MKSQKIPAIERQVHHYEIRHKGLLCRRVYDVADGELQLRVVVPTGRTSWMEVPGVGARELRMSDRILLEYHNNVLEGHLGRDKTYARLERDWCWPGMYSDVISWCKHCLPCQKENSRSALNSWGRTELYDRHFGVIQIDMVTCRSKTKRLRLWVVPCSRELIGMAMLPTVIRTDNDPSFLSELFFYMNRMVNIMHITGSTNTRNHRALSRACKRL